MIYISFVRRCYRVTHNGCFLESRHSQAHPLCLTLCLRRSRTQDDHACAILCLCSNTWAALNARTRNCHHLPRTCTRYPSAASSRPPSPSACATSPPLHRRPPVAQQPAPTAHPSPTTPQPHPHPHTHVSLEPACPVGVHACVGGFRAGSRARGRGCWPRAGGTPAVQRVQARTEMSTHTKGEATHARAPTHTYPPTHPSTHPPTHTHLAGEDLLGRHVLAVEAAVDAVAGADEARLRRGPHVPAWGGHTRHGTHV
jgi:hypothetical protein